MILHAYVDVYVLCVCIVGYGGDYTTLLGGFIVSNDSNTFKYVNASPWKLFLFYLSISPKDTCLDNMSDSSK